MKKLRNFLLTAAVLLSLSGCSAFSVYKIDIAQGNIITQDMVNKIEIGMTKPQVRYIMGTPLISHTFDHNRWDYHWRYQSPKGKITERSVTFFFKEGQLNEIKGDILPETPKKEATPTKEESKA